MIPERDVMFYETLWRYKGRNLPYPTPWWVRQYFRQASSEFDSGLFSTKEAAFASNAHYRYWNIVGVKDHVQESIIGQAGEIEPVYEHYSVRFFLFDPATRQLHFPGETEPGAPFSGLDQDRELGFLPVIRTFYSSPAGVDVEERVFCTVAGQDHKDLLISRFKVKPRPGAAFPLDVQFCLLVSSGGPTGLQRRDKAGRFMFDHRVTLIRYLTAKNRLEINGAPGPMFDKPPQSWGMYGNPGSNDFEYYIDNGPFLELHQYGTLNGAEDAVDYAAGLACGVLRWPCLFNSPAGEWTLDVRLPVDDIRGEDDLAEIAAADPDALEAANKAFWVKKLTTQGPEFQLPPTMTGLHNTFRVCRANLLILSDHGQIHPGPTIYDEFWIRDSAVEGIACALSGDVNLALQQFGTHYAAKFNLNRDWLGPVCTYGHFGGDHERNDREWDSNGQALWAFGMLDRILGPGGQFGKAKFIPYVLEGARWIRDNRTPHGLLYPGWSAEHLGRKDRPHYWDDFWALAGLWEAEKLANRLGAQPEADEIAATRRDLSTATADSIRWVLGEQKNRGHWETFIPTGPADVGRRDSTMVGALAYFHPCRLYMGNKLGDDVDLAARMTVETIWAHFMKEGGFRHDSAWNCFGPYLTLQLAHVFLLLGDLQRMRECLEWTVEEAGYCKMSAYAGCPEKCPVVLGCWNEQHCYPVATDFQEIPFNKWYMGDIPHGWACAEFQLLLRDMMFFEADIDGAPHVYLAPGIAPEWLGDQQAAKIENAPTLFGRTFGFQIVHEQNARRLIIDITQPLPGYISYYVPCRFGRITSATADGAPAQIIDAQTAVLPPQTNQAIVDYA